MKYIPIPFFIISIVFALSAFFADGFIPLKSTDFGGYPKSNDIANADSLLNQLNDSFAKLKATSSLSFGESPGSEEMAMAIFERQQTKLRQELDSTKEQTQELIELLKVEIEHRKILENRIFQQSGSNTGANYSLVIAFMSLLVSVIAMLPSWIQLLRSESS
ncbi:hypothetical protein ACFSJ3_15985 [Corallincola platygyrae]|uniref:Uncharacterized protein n=1 Tax=Corallincola platygyrae TaxID=1193278 RepID=A0ABW4XSL3_9GAMM